MPCRSRAQPWIVLGLAALLAACGGGGGGGGGDGGGTGEAAPPPPPPPTNVMAVTVAGGPTSAGVNLLLGSVTVCTPGNAAQCQTINNILIDTGSNGLRVMAEALNGSAALTPVTSGAGVLSECLQFADSFTWGPVRRADVTIAEKKLSNVPIQVIDNTFAGIPADCLNSGTNGSTIATFGANGVLGVGTGYLDCGNRCVGNIDNNQYFSCIGSTCTDATVPAANQVRNPVGDFDSDNNGVIISLPNFPGPAAGSLTGELIFGIGTQSNNALSGNAFVVQVANRFPAFRTDYGGRSMPLSFLDSGSNGLFFSDGTIPNCTSASLAPEFYCPTSTLSLSARIFQLNAANSTTIGFDIANADSLFRSNAGARVFKPVGADIGLTSSFDWGLPFFIGRRVYTAREGVIAAGIAGPYIAFE